MVLTAPRCKIITIHSFRVWLACALLAIGATPEQIMQLLRWSSDEARKLYARMGENAQSGLLDSACDARFDSVRSHTLLHTAGEVERMDKEAEAAAAKAAAAAALRPTRRVIQRAPIGPALLGPSGTVLAIKTFHVSKSGELVMVPDEGTRAVTDEEVTEAQSVEEAADLLHRAQADDVGPLPPASSLPPIDDDATMARLHGAAGALATRAAAVDSELQATNEVDDASSDED